MLDGARLVVYDGHRQRVLVWPGHPLPDETPVRNVYRVAVEQYEARELVDVISLRSLTVTGVWVCDGTVDAAAAAIEERVNAGY
jgi:hypothetical protein